jgi:hypothetical protein
VHAEAPATTSQQERGDAGGTWQVYDLLPGRYQLVTTAAGRGLAIAKVTVPGPPVALKLSGTGRIAGTITGVTTGTLAVAYEACTDALVANRAIPIAPEPQLVPVRGGRFELDDVPACDLALVATWRGQSARAQVAVAAGDTAQVELVLGPRHDKTVHGRVRDRAGHAVSDVRVTALFGGEPIGTAMTDGDGRFTLHAVSGAQLVAEDGTRRGTAVAGTAHVADELVDLQVQ